LSETLVHIFFKCSRSSCGKRLLS